MIAFVFNLLLTLAISYAIGDIINKLTRDNKKPSPRDMQYPLLEDGKEYPVLFGCAWTPMVPVWYGDLETIAIKKEIGRELDWWAISNPVPWIPIPGHKSHTNPVYQTIGYHYLLGLECKLLTGTADGIKQLRFGEKVAWPNPDDDTEVEDDGITSIELNLPYFYGGEEAGGGLVGKISVRYGASSQLQNDYLVEQRGSGISAGRGVFGIVFEHFNFGTSGFLGSNIPIALLKRTDQHTDGSEMWYISKADTNVGLNAVHVLYECYTDRQWGLKYSTALIDDTSWEDAADTAYVENFGWNRLWDSSFQSLHDFIKEVKQALNCVIYKDFSTGKIKIKLIRDDYVVDDLETFDDEDILELSGFSRESYGKIPTSVVVKYWDLTLNKDASYPLDDISTLEIQNGLNITKIIEYYGVSDETLAGVLASRDLQLFTSRLCLFKIRTKRTMSHLNPGDCFKLNWELSGVSISSMVVRIMTAYYGSSVDSYCEFGCCQDAFNTESALYANAPSTGWTDPYNLPDDVTYYILLETPFWIIIREIGEDAIAELGNDDGFLIGGAAKTSGDCLDYRLLVREGLTDDFYDNGRWVFTPTATVDDELPLNAQDVTVDLSNVQSLADIEVGDFAVVGNEILKVLDIDIVNNQVELARGCLDTVPALHSEDSRIWFLGSSSFYAGDKYTVTDQPGVKFLPRTGKGELDEGDATAHNATAFNSRMIRPYPPGNFKINNVSYPSSFSGQPTLTWSHRDRTEQLEEIIEHDDLTDYGPEAGTTYTLKIYDEDNILVRTETGLTGKTYTYSEEDEIADCVIESGGALNTQLRFVLNSVRSGYDSWQSYDITVARV